MLVGQVVVLGVVFVGQVAVLASRSAVWRATGGPPRGTVIGEVWYGDRFLRRVVCEFSVCRLVGVRSEGSGMVVGDQLE